MSEIATLIEQDLSVASRCYFFGTTPLGGTDACRPEMQADGSIILRSLNLSHVAYRVTEEKYRELRQHPQRKVGMWDFIREDDQDADHIASATRYPQSAGRRIGDLERALVAKDAEIAQLRQAITSSNFCAVFLDGRNEHGSHVLASYPRSFDVVDDDISEQAEAILVAAENEGFQIGEHVWAEFNWVDPQYGDEGREELSGYWDFKRINVEMTRAALKEPA